MLSPRHNRSQSLSSSSRKRTNSILPTRPESTAAWPLLRQLTSLRPDSDIACQTMDRLKNFFPQCRLRNFYPQTRSYHRLVCLLHVRRQIALARDRSHLRRTPARASIKLRSKWKASTNTKSRVWSDTELRSKSSSVTNVTNNQTVSEAHTNFSATRMPNILVFARSGSASMAPKTRLCCRTARTAVL